MNLTRPLVLASSSPRRQQLLRDLGFAFAVRTKDTPEDFPSALAAADVPVYLAEKKARAFDEGTHWRLSGKKIFITNAMEAEIFVVFIFTTKAFTYIFSRFYKLYSVYPFHHFIAQLILDS